jgi:thiol:disulfide interchange protein DsbD
VLFWILAAVVCVLAAVGIAWHLHTKEGEEKKPARMRGIQVAALTAAAIAVVAWYTHVPDNLLSWTYAKSPEHLQELVAKSTKQGKPVVVDFWGEWCTNCKVYDKRIATTQALRERFERITRIKVDLSGEDQVRWPMRDALGVEESGAPIMVFIDRQGRIRRKADLVGLEDDDVVMKHIDVVLKKKQPAKTGKR